MFTNDPTKIIKNIDIYIMKNKNEPIKFILVNYKFAIFFCIEYSKPKSSTFFKILIPMISKERSGFRLLPLLKNAIGSITEGVHDLYARWYGDFSFFP